MKFENFLVNELPKSKLTVNELYTLSQSSMFKTKTKVRASKVGKIHYVGFKYTYHRDHQGDKKLIVYINLYFYVMGASHKGKREKYLLVAKFPYTTKIKNMKRLYDEPVQIFSSDPSFKYYLTYALNKFNAVITDDLTFVNHLGQSLTQKPIINNIEGMAELTKHFWKFFYFIGNIHPKKYLDKKYELKWNDKINIINKNV